MTAERIHRAASGPDDNRSRFLSVLRSARRRREPALDESEIRWFLERDYPRLVNAVALACGSYPAAEDAVQEALVRAWIRSERGDRFGSLAAWVTAVALNHTRSAWRRSAAERRARARLAERGTAAAPPGEDHVEVTRARGPAAPPREVAVLRYLLAFDTGETAEALAISEGTVKSSLSRARAHLAEALRVRDLEVNDVEGR
jgi:DNA-directed RNA polymerase specialized sigma24 family protein